MFDLKIFVLASDSAGKGKNLSHHIRTPMRARGHQFQSFTADSPAATALLAAGASDRATALDPRELAAWMMVANVLLNLDETLTKG